jgi:hypothetical protein
LQNHLTFSKQPNNRKGWYYYRYFLNKRVKPMKKDSSPNFKNQNHGAAGWIPIVKTM